MGKERLAAFSAGGAPMQIEVDTQLQKLECTFNLGGWTPHVATLIGSWTQAHLLAASEL